MPTKLPKNIGVILAAGRSERTTVSKLWQESLPGAPRLLKPILTFQACSFIDHIYIVANNFSDELKNLCRQYEVSKFENIIIGGKSRYESVRNAVELLTEKGVASNTNLIFHNAANPDLPLSDLEGAMTMVELHDVIICGYYSSDCVKEVDREGKIVNQLPRSNTFIAQTPQIAKIELFQKAYKRSSTMYPDESSLLATITNDIFVYKTNPINRKITHNHDLLFDYRLGYGEDTHKFMKNYDPNKKLILAGFTLPEHLSIEAESDGDIVLHALYNAISSALGEQPIGFVAKAMCQNGIKDSRVYLQKAIDRMLSKNFMINNLVVHIETKKPSLSKYHEKIQQSLSTLLRIEPNQVGLVYESGDNCSSFAQGIGIRASAHVLLKKIT